MHYRAEIDGLRAIAVVPVILFHAGFDAFSGGFVGVDIFFVISGYLITSILLLEIYKDQFSLVNFYERRARRILPALFFVVLVCIPFAWMWLLPSDMKDFSQSVVAVAAFSSNFLFWGESGYFDTETEVKPLLHTWSLAVEEQFYVLFPLLLILARMLKPFILVFMLSLIAVISYAFAEWGSRYSPEAAFYLLPFRAFELMLGAITAFYVINNSIPKSSQFLSLTGLTLIVVPIFYFDKQTLFPGVYALFPTFGAVLIILFATPTTIASKILSSKILVGIGLISYSAYLWHQPLFAFARYNVKFDVTYISMTILTLVTFALAFITWRAVEAPFRNRRKTSRILIFGSAVTVSAIYIVFGALGHYSNGFPARFPSEVLNIASDMPKLKIDGTECFGRANDFCGQDQINGERQDVFVIGDSSIEPIAKQLQVRGQNLNVIDINSAGCVLIKYFELRRNNVTDPSCSTEKFEYVLNLIKKSKNPVVIWGGMTPKVLSGKWYQRFGKLSHADPITGTDEWHKKYYSSNKNMTLQESIVETLETLSQESTLLIILYPNVEFGVNVSKTLKMKYLHSDFKKDSYPALSLPLSEFLMRSKPAFELLDSIPGNTIRRIYPHMELCSEAEGLCYANTSDTVYFVDQIHPSDEGAELIADRIVEKLK